MYYTASSVLLEVFIRVLGIFRLAKWFEMWPSQVVCTYCSIFAVKHRQKNNRQRVCDEVDTMANARQIANHWDTIVWFFSFSISSIKSVECCLQCEHISQHEKSVFYSKWMWSVNFHKVQPTVSEQWAHTRYHEYFIANYWYKTLIYVEHIHVGNVCHIFSLHLSTPKEYCIPQNSMEKGHKVWFLSWHWWRHEISRKKKNFIVME